MLEERKETMTSLEIAELTGKQHKDLMKSIRSMEDAWVKVGRRKFAPSSYKNSQNKDQPMYNLTKTECLYIATKFNDEARARLIIRWEELENNKSDYNLITDQDEVIRQVSHNNRSIEFLHEKYREVDDFISRYTHGVIKGKLRDLDREVDMLKRKFKELERKATYRHDPNEAIEEITSVNGVYPIGVVAKLLDLGYGPINFMKKLIEMGFMSHDYGYKLPKQMYIDNGVFVIKDKQVYITESGMSWLRDKISSYDSGSNY